MQVWEGQGVVATGRQMLGETDPVSAALAVMPRLHLVQTPHTHSDNHTGQGIEPTEMQSQCYGQ